MAEGKARASRRGRKKIIPDHHGDEALRAAGPLLRPGSRTQTHEKGNRNHRGKEDDNHTLSRC